MKELGKLFEKEIEKRYIAKISVDIDLRDMEHIKALLDKEQPVAPRKEEKYASLLYCPCCDNMLSTGDLYCSHCGQRIDTENVAL